MLPKKLLNVERDASRNAYKDSELKEGDARSVFTQKCSIR